MGAKLGEFSKVRIGVRIESYGYMIREMVGEGSFLNF